MLPSRPNPGRTESGRRLAAVHSQPGRYGAPAMRAAQRERAHTVPREQVRSHRNRDHAGPDDREQGNRGHLTGRLRPYPDTAPNYPIRMMPGVEVVVDGVTARTIERPGSRWVLAHCARLIGSAGAADAKPSEGYARAVGS